MKREELEKIEGLSKEAIDKIMALHGADIEAHKTKLTTAQTEIDGLKTQVTEANKQIEAFKGMDIEGVKKSAEEWKGKAEKAAEDSQKQIAQLKFDHALEGALTGAKAKNSKAVRALLNTELLKLNESDGTIIGLEDQLKAIREKNDFLFEGDQVDPKIVAGTEKKSTVSDPVLAAMRQGAGLSGEKGN